MPEPIVLEGRFVRLEPLSETHIDPLVAAASEDRSNYQWSTAPNGRAQTERYVTDAMAKVAGGEQVAFATVRKGGGSADRVVGSTRFYEVATWRWPDGSPHQRVGVPDVVDIGYTWLAASAQRSPVNTEAKLLMLGQAFEVWRVAVNRWELVRTPEGWRTAYRTTRLINGSDEARELLRRAGED